MVQEDKNNRNNLDYKFVESFDDFFGLNFKDVVSFPDGRKEVVIQNHYEEGKCVTCRKISGRKKKEIRKIFYSKDSDLNSAKFRDFRFNKDSSDFERGQYAFLDLILNSSYRNT